MAASFIRPRVAELLFCVYDRPLHPELFEVLAVRTVYHETYRFRAGLTRTGHVWTWDDGRVHLTELTAGHEHELPASGRRLGHRLDGTRGARFQVGGVNYRVSSQIEVLPPEQFAHLHEELASEGVRKGLVYHCPPGNRLKLSPLGVLIASTVRDGLSVIAFHTFPDEYTVVKSQSLIEWA